MFIHEEALGSIQELIGHDFKHVELLKEALTHRSALSRRNGRQKRTMVKGKGSNERLEFVGDRVLGLLIAEWLYEKYPEEQEGALGARHAHLVSRPVLADIAEKISLSKALHIAAHEESAGIRGLASVKADAMEALLGALYLDAGLEPARNIVRKLWGKRIEKAGTPHKEPKTILQELVLSSKKTLPIYRLISSEGPSHAPIFCVEVSAMGEIGMGKAGSKRLAESAAAENLLSKLGKGA